MSHRPHLDRYQRLASQLPMRDPVAGVKAERNQTKGRSKTLPPRPSGGDGPRGSG